MARIKAATVAFSPLLAILAACHSVAPDVPIASANQSTTTAAAPRANLCSDLLDGQASQFELTVADADGRPIPITVFFPYQPGTYRLIAFSHGAFAAPDRYLAMLQPLAASGYIVVAPMHIDSEEMERREPPSQSELWNTRNIDMQMALAPSSRIIGELAERGFAIADAGPIAMGHSFGSVMAHFASGVRSTAEAGDLTVRQIEGIGAVIAWSPPGAMEGVINQMSWSELAAPSLTLTGTTDVLPGFVDDWTLRKVPFEQAPAGTSELWVGEGIDHYFGGMFGRERPADAQSQALFDRAIAQTLAFIHRSTNVAKPCVPGALIAGETYETR